MGNQNQSCRSNLMRSINGKGRGSNFKWKTKMTSKPIITGVHVDSLMWGETRAAAGFEFNGARYHIWFNLKTMKSDGTLYKNSIAKHDEPGYYHARKLDPTKPNNKAMLAEMWRQIKEGHLVARALAASQAMENARIAEAADALRVHLIKEAGPKLLEALKLARNCISYCRALCTIPPLKDGMTIETFIDNVILSIETQKRNQNELET